MVLISHRQVSGVYDMYESWLQVGWNTYSMFQVYSRMGSEVDAIPYYGGPSIALWNASDHLVHGMK